MFVLALSVSPVVDSDGIAALNSARRHVHELEQFSGYYSSSPGKPETDQEKARQISLKWHRLLNLAMKDYTRALDDEKLDVVDEMAARYERAALYLLVGRTEDALRDADAMVRLGPDTHTGYALRALLHERKREYPDAIRDYSSAVEHADKLARPVMYLYRGLAYDKFGDAEHALQDFNAALAERPDFAAAYAQRGLLHFRNKRYQESLRDCETALDMATPTEYARPFFVRAIESERFPYLDLNLRIGFIHELQGDQRRAVDAYLVATGIDAREYMAYERIAYLYAAAKDPSMRDAGRSLDYAQQALALRPGGPRAHAVTALAYLANGRFGEATEHVAAARRIGRHDDELDRFLRQLEERIGHGVPPPGTDGREPPRFSLAPESPDLQREIISIDSGESLEDFFEN